MHKDGIRNSQQCKRLLQVILRTKNEIIMAKYNRLIFPANHITKCTMMWRSIPQQEWTHLFVHILYNTLKNCYIEL
jgi:hypothetical protein